MANNRFRADVVVIDDPERVDAYSTKRARAIRWPSTWPLKPFE